MKKFLCICLTLIIALHGFMVIAADSNITCKWENNTITVTAPNGTFTSGAQVDMVVLSPGKTLADVTEDGAVVCTSTEKATMLGGVTFTENMKVKSDGGYPVYLIPGGDDSVVSGTVYCEGMGVGSVTIVSAEKDGSTIAVTVEVEGVQNGDMYIAAYNTDGKMVAVDVFSAADGTYTISGNDAAEVKAMIFEGSNLKPLAISDKSPL